MVRFFAAALTVFVLVHPAKAEMSAQARAFVMARTYVEAAALCKGLQDYRQPLKNLAAQMADEQRKASSNPEDAAYADGFVRGQVNEIAGRMLQNDPGACAEVYMNVAAVLMQRLAAKP